MDDDYTPNILANTDSSPWEKTEFQPLVNYQPSALMNPTMQHAHYLLNPQSHPFASLMPVNVSMLNSFADCLPPLQMVPNLHNFSYNYIMDQKEDEVVEDYQGVVQEEVIIGEKSPEKTAKPKKTPSSYRRRKSPIYEGEYIDTKKLCEEIAFELRSRCIPQTLFAEKIIGRSQGTLSDLLKNPKPWDKLKSGRETFKRMKTWLELPLDQKMAVFGMGTDLESKVAPIAFPPALESAKKLTTKRKSENNSSSPCKRPRIVFTEVQKRTLDAIFDETRHPSREMQEIIAARLLLEFQTVNNYFMNMRRRSNWAEN